jgi:hypothetical protein
MTDAQKASLRSLRQCLKTSSLDDPLVYHALGTYVLSCTGDQRGQYGKQTLNALGQHLREQLPRAFPDGDLAPQLQAAVRLTKAFSEQELRSHVRRRGDHGSFRLSVSHLGYVASACKTREVRERWIQRCIQRRWSARQLHAELKQAFPGRSHGGRLLSSPRVGLSAVDRALAALERFTSHSSGQQALAALSKAEKQEIQQSISGCAKRLQQVALAWSVTGSRAKAIRTPK